MTPKTARRWLILALWLVCLCPLWAAIWASPAGFWQTFSVGCAQTVLGLVAIAGTALIYIFEV